jgi:2Fe-2S ferredoxin
MVKIVIENLAQKELLVNDPAKPVLRLIQESGVDWMTDCGAKGRCTTCRAIILSGGENLTPDSPAETRYRSQGLLYPDERLMCQVRTRGDLVLRVPDETKLPHMKYTR